MVKPGMPYLDLVREVKDKVSFLLRSPPKASEGVDPFHASKLRWTESTWAFGVSPAKLSKEACACFVSSIPTTRWLSTMCRASSPCCGMERTLGPLT